MAAEQRTVPVELGPLPATERRNDLLRQARLRRRSRSNPNRPMSQRELAEAVTAYVQRTTGRDIALDRHVINRWESGKRRPMAEYRSALRVVLGVATDDELGFHVPARPRPRSETPIASTTGEGATDPTDASRPARQLANPNAAANRSHNLGGKSLKIEAIRFTSRNEDEAYFYRIMHQLAAGCLLMGARDAAVRAVLEVMGRAVAQRKEPPVVQPSV